MKRNNYLVLLGFITMFLIISCERHNNNQNFTGILIDHSHCKSSKSAVLKTETPDTLSCINYLYEKSGNKLSLKHINAGFNCCPDGLYCSASLRGDTIIIKESEKSALCDCDCLYDLDIEINGVAEGIYQIKFIEPYCGKQEKIIFKIDLAEHPGGIFCVSRKQYPWGMGS